MPSNWIKEKADREAAANAEAEHRQEIRLRQNELIKALGQKFLKDLIKSLNEDITEWNSRFKDRQINGVGEIPGGYHVDKPAFPRGSAYIRFNPETLRIEIGMERSRPMDGGMYKEDTFVQLEADPDMKNIHMENRSRAHFSISQFTQAVILGIADPMSHSSF